MLVYQRVSRNMGFTMSYGDFTRKMVIYLGKQQYSPLLDGFQYVLSSRMVGTMICNNQ